MKNLPLYQEARSSAKIDDHGSKGLFFERFFDGYESDWSVQHGKRSDWLRKFSCKCGEKDYLHRTACDLLKLAKSLDGAAKVFSTEWNFVTGMGNPHPVENGLSWHHTADVPYLTGSGVKGLIRAWVFSEWSDSSNALKADAESWFGCSSDDDENGTGSLIFFDALPCKPVLIETDIMTPHAGKWYLEGDEIKDASSDGSRVPGDWHSPNPISFLVVKRATFLFVIAPRPLASPNEANEAMDELEKALRWMGAGAKTAAGYGRMLPDDAALQELLSYS